MSKEYRRDSINNELDKLQEQMKLLNKLGGLLEEQQSRNLSISKQMNIQNDILETRRKLEAQGLKNLQTQFAVDTKAIEIDKRISMLYDERLRLQESISREKEKQAKIDAENARKSRVERDAELKSDIERIKNHSRINDLEEKQLHRQKAIARAYKDKSDAEKQEIMNNDAKLKQLEKSIKLEQKARQREEKSKQTKDNAIDSIRIPGLGSVGSLKEFSELKLSAQIFSVGVETFNKAVETFTGLFKDGYTNIARNANSQFQNISTRTGMSYGTYRSGIAGMGNTLKNWGGLNLQDNLRTSDIQTAMNNLATQGVGQEQLFASAIETVLTKNIVPYLDNLESSEMQQLNAVTNGDLMKQVRGIAKVNTDLYDSNTVATKYLQQQLQYLAPMASVAGLELIQNDEQMLTYYEGLRAQGMSDYMIGQSINSINQMRYNQADTMQNGTTFQKYVMANSYANGINPLLDGVGFANMYESAASQFGSMIPSDGGLLTSIASNALGMPGDDRSAYYYANADLNHNKALSNALSADYGGASNYASKLFASGANQTAEVKQVAYMENMATEVAMIKTDMGRWFDTLTTAVQGIAKILIAWGIGKITGIGNIGGNGINLTQGLTKGFMPGASNVAGAGKLGFMSGTGGAIAGAAGATAGIALAADGATKAYEAFEEGETGIGVGRTVQAAGGAVGAAALLALGASNPIGWVALAVGGLAAVATSAYETATSYKKAGKEVEKEWDNYAYGLRGEIRNREQSIMKTEEFLKDEEDLEKARAELINSGMLSEEDMQKAQRANKEELIKLTEQYKQSTQDFKGISKEIMNELKGKQAGEANDTVKSIQDWIKGTASNEYNEANLEVLTDLRERMVAKIEAKGDSASDDEKEYLKRVNKNKGKGKNGQADILWEFKDWDDGYKSVATALTKEDLEEFTDYANYMGVGSIKEYSYINPEEAEYATQLLSYANSKESAEEAFSYLKNIGFSEVGSLPSNTKAKVEGLISTYGASYRVGTNRIPYDNYPALLHEGEAVLTASTANELRGLIDEYRETRNDSARISQAIENQTNVLVARLDAIYAKMPSSEEVQAQEIMPGRLNQNARNMTTPFNIF